MVSPSNGHTVPTDNIFFFPSRDISDGWSSIHNSFLHRLVWSSGSLLHQTDLVFPNLCFSSPLVNGISIHTPSHLQGVSFPSSPWCNMALCMLSQWTVSTSDVCNSPITCLKGNCLSRFSFTLPPLPPAEHRCDGDPESTCR